jgi:hypothetical protein
MALSVSAGNRNFYTKTKMQKISFTYAILLIGMLLRLTSRELQP